MIRCTCTIPNCFFVIRYYPPITMADVVKSPPFDKMPLLENEHNHQWKIEEVPIRGKK